ncbi:MULTISPECIES: YhzD family protein [Planomicrobium]|jgi:hypothetical protein|uniref:YhzD family protein n=1 Tax=Planomicrobium okeanokoites TaxID=244 RepID=A0ABV7KLW8_PLAOK|nr:MULTISPECIES: YhzD family protein [Planomicrobium]PKH08868.1 hypothetical protein CXF70_14420 [Planomicrobium sp. MB-3u-38]TAA67822.1 hypothetical protein D2910_12995 [Planomicrobium okeanokoites]
MRTYKLTAFEQTGKLITEETFTAENDDLAKEKGREILKEKELEDQTHRLASPAGKLLLFHS